MKCIATYPSYEEANERQLDLLAAEIDAVVKYVPTGFDQVYTGANPIYALFVEEDRAADASDLIRLVADENHRAIFRCPECESNEVKEFRLDEGFGSGPFTFAMTLGLFGLGRMVVTRVLGTKYQCKVCGTSYRKKV